MDDKKKAKKKIHIQRAFSYSRLGTEFMSAAYENLVPIQQISLSVEKSLDIHTHPTGCADGYRQIEVGPNDDMGHPKESCL